MHYIFLTIDTSINLTRKEVFIYYCWSQSNEGCEFLISEFVNKIYLEMNQRLSNSKIALFGKLFVLLFRMCPFYVFPLYLAPILSSSKMHFLVVWPCVFPSESFSGSDYSSST